MADEIVEAARDVIGILRAWYLSDREATKRNRIASTARSLQQALDAMVTFPKGSDEYLRANAQAERALNEASQIMHFNESLAPVLGAAASRLRRIKDGRR